VAGHAPKGERAKIRNIGTALASVGGDWQNVVQFTTYLVHSQDIAKFMEFRKRHFPIYFRNGVYPPNTLLMIDRLVHLVEVQTIAAL
jgi:enamine deaminase RidA (YjgF/YER057c/UK114 family)